MAFDISHLREQFPILSRQINNKPLIYLDSGASAQKPLAVIEAMNHLMRHSYANVHRGLYRMANEVTSGFEAGREAVAKFINSEIDEIIFTKSATEAINLVAHSFGARLKSGDEILITEMEHHANIVPWHMLAERIGATLKWCPILDDGALDLEAFDQLLSPKTKIVAFTQMSNVLGTINPVKALVEKAHAVGAVTVIDGSQAIVHQAVDVKDLDCDFYAFSSHKLYGPTGLGVLYGKADILRDMPPFLGGGEMIAYVSKDRITYNEPPHRFEAGTPPILEVAGLKAAIDWLNGLDREAIHAHEMALYDRALKGLQAQNSISIHGTVANKGAILTFTMRGAHAHDVAQILDQHNVCVRAGTHCAEPLMTRLGVTSSVRASFALYNTEAEVDAFVAAVAKAQTFFE